MPSGFQLKGTKPMNKRLIRHKAQQYADLIKDKYPVKKVILLKNYPGEEDDDDGSIEIAVVVSELEDDYLEAKDELTRLAKQIHPKIDPLLVEEDKPDPFGFTDEIQGNEEIIFHHA